MDDVDDRVLLTTFQNGFTSDLFIHKMFDREPQKMAELLHSAQSFMNVDDAITAKCKKKANWVEAGPHAGYIHLEQNPHPKKARMGEKRDQDGKKARSLSLNTSHD